MPASTRKHTGGSPKNNTRRKLKIKPVKEPASIEPTIAEPTIMEKLSGLNPFRSSAEPIVAEPIEQKSCATEKCSVGQRCDSKTKICYKLTDLTLTSAGRNIILTVDGKRGKNYDFPFLNKNFDRIDQLKHHKIDDKLVTIPRMGKIIKELKTKLVIDTTSTYYGTLKDELIIQLIYLEQLERDQQVKPDIEVVAPETVETNDTPPVVVSTKVASLVETELNSLSPVKADEQFEPPDPDNLNAYDVPDIDVSLTEDEEKIHKLLGVSPAITDKKKYNEFLRNKEILEKQNIELEDTYDFLYPELDDPNFNSKIAKRKEFNDTQYDGEIYDVKKQAEEMCKAEFELMPHQVFVKNFLSFQTPYNSLLLYHGLGTGKTCSAIGVAEEMRDYMKQVGVSPRIMVIASPNVQNNFRLQLFDERKLREEGGIWNLETCIGSTLLHEINPTQIQNVTKDRVIAQVNSIINQYYLFMGYGELANYIKRKIAVDVNSNLSVKQQKQMEIGKIQEIFNNRLVIIDEVHNIRIMQDNKESKKTANLLMYVCEHAYNMRLLLLSATPVYNNHREIIWLTNMLNAVDKRSLIEESDVFDKQGEFIESRTLPDGSVLEAGEELLRRKLTGYVSYVRGENPYTFPYRIYPVDFAPDKVLNLETYPSMQMNNKPIDDKPSKIPLYMNDIGDYQRQAYDFVIQHLLQRSFSTMNAYGETREMPTFENMESFGYTHLREPLQSLNIVYPYVGFTGDSTESSVEEVTVEEPNPDETSESDSGESDSSDDDSASVDEDILQKNTNIINNMIGKQGLSNVMTFEQTSTPYELRHNFKYKPEITDTYGAVFHPDNIKKYSGKIHNICNLIQESTGIVMVYSQFIDGGVVPMALALEELGFTRYGFASHTKSLFAAPPTEQIDATTYKTLDNMEDKSKFRPAKYVMITGDKSFSPNNLADLKHITNPDNKNGENVKVILITKAAAEGLDFKNIRQLHVLEPWYNMNRVEQIIGRAVRNLSHCNLPFEERNVEIYLHASTPTDEKETADLYIYRYAENKALQIGKITRILKELAVDCILNIGQSSFTIDKLNALAENQNIQLTLSSKQEIEYKIGDKEGSGICDYMNCDFVCSPTTVINETDINKNTYSEHYVKMNYGAIAKRIRDLFKEQTFYKREPLVESIQIMRQYPIEQIDYVLSMFIENKHNYITDKYGRNGYLVNSGDFYGYQPVEISDEQSTIYERTVPVDYKPAEMFMELPTQKVTTDIPEVQVLNDQVKTLPNIIKTEKQYDVLLKQLLANLETVRIERKRSSEYLMETAESDWYKHLGHVYIELDKHMHIPLISIEKYTVYHWLDTIHIDDKLTILFHLYKTDSSMFSTELTMNANEHDDEIMAKEGAKARAPVIMKTYFDDKMLLQNGERGLALGHNNHIDLYVQIVETRQWKKATLSVVRGFKDKLRERYYIDTTTIQPFVGFMHLFKKNDMVFKIKETTKPTGIGKHIATKKGFKCSVMGKKDIIKIFNNNVLANSPYPVQPGGLVKYDVNENAKNIMRVGFCVLMEMVIRYFNDSPETKGKHVWFFDVEKTLANDLTKM